MSDTSETTDADFVAAWRKTFRELEAGGSHISHSAMAIKRMLGLLDAERERCAKIAAGHNGINPRDSRDIAAKIRA